MISNALHVQTEDIHLSVASKRTNPAVLVGLIYAWLQSQKRIIRRFTAENPSTKFFEKSTGI